MLRHFRFWDGQFFNIFGEDGVVGTFVILYVLSEELFGFLDWWGLGENVDVFGGSLQWSLAFSHAWFFLEEFVQFFPALLQLAYTLFLHLVFNSIYAFALPPLSPGVQLDVQHGKPQPIVDTQPKCSNKNINFVNILDPLFQVLPNHIVGFRFHPIQKLKNKRDSFSLFVAFGKEVEEVKQMGIVEVLGLEIVLEFV